MAYTEAQFNRLPKWAQTEISRLQGNVEYHRKQYETAIGNYPITDETAVIQRYDHDDIPLPRCNLRFLKQGVSITVRDGKVNVTTERGPMRVLPSASNLIIIETETR